MGNKQKKYEDFFEVIDGIIIALRLMFLFTGTIFFSLMIKLVYAGMRGLI